MVALTSRFTLLAALASLATVSLVDAVPLHRSTQSLSSPSSKQAVLRSLVIPPPPARKHAKAKEGEPTQNSGKGRRYQHQHTPGRNLGTGSKRNSNTPDNNWPSLNPRRHHHKHGRPIVNVHGNNNDIHDRRHDHHDHHDHDHDHHRHDGHGKVIVKGNNDHIIFRRRSSDFVPNQYGGSDIASRSHKHGGKMVKDNFHSLKRSESSEQIEGLLAIYDASDNSTGLAQWIAVNPNNSVIASSKATPVTLLVNSGNNSMSTALIQVSVDDPSSGNTTQLCATYNPCPGLAELLTMEKCFGDSPSPPCRSQTFIYNSTSNAVQPTGLESSQDSGSEDDDDSGDEDEDDASSTTSPELAGTRDVGASNGTELSSRDTSTTQGVSLIFVPESGRSVDPNSDAGQDDASTTTSTVTTTSTDTTTITVTRMAAVMDITGTPSSTTQIDDSDLPSSSATNSEQTLTTTDGSGVTSTLSPIAPTSVGPLDVEVVAPTASSSADPSSITGTDSSDSTDTTSPSPASSINAEAVASSVAASWSSTTADSPTATDSSSPNTPANATDAPMSSFSRTLYQKRFRGFMPDPRL